MQFDHTMTALLDGVLACFVAVGTAAVCTMIKRALKKRLRREKDRSDRQEADRECRQE